MKSLFWIAQICSLCGAVCVAISTFGKEKKELVRWQIADTIFNATANLLLWSFSGFVVNFVSFVRNILAYKNKLTRWVTAALSIVMVIVGLYANNRGLIGVIPVAASVSYTIGMHLLKTAQSMRILIAINVVIWMIYDVTIRSYPIAVMDGVILLTTALNLARRRR